MRNDGHDRLKEMARIYEEIQGATCFLELTKITAKCGVGRVADCYWLMDAAAYRGLELAEGGN